MSSAVSIEQVHMPSWSLAAAHAKALCPNWLENYQKLSL